MIRITANRKSRYMATGYSVKEESWDEQNNRIFEIRNSKFPKKKILSNANAMNSDIEQQVNEVIRAKQQVSLTEQTQSSQRIKDKVRAKYGPSENFVEYGKYLAKLSMDGNKVKTSRNYTGVLKKINIYQNERPLLFSDITVAFLSQYEAYLIKGGAKTNTVRYHLSTIRGILYKAMNENEPLFPQEKNPFLKFRIKIAKTQKETLSTKEIEMLRKAKLKLPQDQKSQDARNYYLFSYNNAGIRISDLIQLKVKNIIDDRLYYEMGKTGHFKSIKLNDRSKEIIKQYKRKNAKPEDFLFPILENDTDYSDAAFLRSRVEAKSTAINAALKDLAKSAKVKKRVHFHSSRHSFANMARKKKADLYSISKALGHSSIKVTENYLTSFDEEALDETMDMIFKK